MLLARIIVFLIILFVFIRPVYTAYLFTYPRRFRVTFRTPSDLGTTYQDVRLTATDGETLAGWYVPSRNGAAIILLHGHSGNRLAVMFHAEALLRAGFGLLMLDLRAHGDSGGKLFAMSSQLIDDGLTAVAFVNKQPDVQPGKIGVMGVSVGGTMALLTATRTVAIRAVAVDAPAPATLADYPSPASWLDKLVKRPLATYFTRMTAIFSKTSPLPPTSEQLATMIPRPIFFIASGSHQEKAITRQFYQHTPQPKHLWEIPGTNYSAAWVTHPDEYAHKLRLFFTQTLLENKTHQLNFMPGESVATPKTEPEVNQLLADTPYTVASDVTLSVGMANLVALTMIPISWVLFFLPYQFIWGASVLDSLVSLVTLNGWLLLGILFGSVIVHELLHVIGYRWVGKVPMSKLHIGMQWKYLTPFAHCQAPLSVNAYQIAVALPGIALGLIPGWLGLVTGSGLLVLYGTLMLIAAGGDAAILWAIRGLAGDVVVLDHPSRVGCYTLTRKPDATSEE
ncbi:MAG: alpha/beta fold hydrolase [Chloroflexi bacterium]|nr:MAG: alpha/beta fold hydrolase [Chloroflexota bacterium]